MLYVFKVCVLRAIMNVNSVLRRGVPATGKLAPHTLI